MSALERLRTSLRQLFSPRGTNLVLKILHGLAMIDEELDERELNFLRAFAKRWGLQLDNALLAEQPSRSGASSAFTFLRDAMEDYLAAKPPTDQARQLRDVMTALVTIDGRICAREELILDELGRMIDAYVGNDALGAYAVTIDTEKSSPAPMPEERAQDSTGSRAGTTIGTYHSRAYAELVANWYRDGGQATQIEFRGGAADIRS